MLDLAPIKARRKAAAKNPLVFLPQAHNDIDALVAEVERLRELVREAYIEGCQDGHCDGWKRQDLAPCWEESNARKRLEGKE